MCTLKIKQNKTPHFFCKLNTFLAVYLLGRKRESGPYYFSECILLDNSIIVNYVVNFVISWIFFLVQHSMLFIFVLLHFSVKWDLTYNMPFAFIVEIYSINKSCTQDTGFSETYYFELFNCV